MRDKPLDTTKHKMHYKPLDKTKDEIRVLKFLNLSSPVSTEDTIRCSIRNVSLGMPRPLQWQSYQRWSPKYLVAWDRFTKSVELRDSTLEQTTDDKIAYARLHRSSPQCSGSRYDWGDFEALSYTWGNTGETKTIYVNGVRKNVPRNLEEALRALRDLEETRSGMCYWVDSLCIDQENIEERNQQVKRMKEVYGLARAVIVWLGQEGEMDRIAVQTMHHLFRSISHGSKNTSSLDEWPVVLAFAQRSYWSRCWIIQELAMNHNSTLFLCGKFMLTRGMILSAGDGSPLLKLLENRGYQSYHKLQLRACAIADRMKSLLHLKPNNDIEWGLDSLLDLVRRADATDERDKIYSILGLLDPAISAGVTPDYSLSVQQVYTDFMKSVINASKRLDQIIFSGTSAEQGWPSWVPDWRKPFQRSFIRYLIFDQARNNTPAQFRFIEEDKDRTYLACRGVHIDIVDGIAAEPPTDSHATQSSAVSDRYSGQTFEAIQKTFCIGHPKMSMKLLFKVPWNLSCDTNDIPSNSEWLKLFQSSSFERWDKFRKYNENFCIGGQKFRTFFAQSDEQGVDIKSLRKMRFALECLDYRALITTRTGYLGLAPSVARPGDVVAILFGCACPVVLRLCNDGLYQLIGECYIHRLMDGEVLSQQRYEHVVEREFILC